MYIYTYVVYKSTVYNINNYALHTAPPIFIFPIIYCDSLHLLLLSGVEKAVGFEATDGDSKAEGGYQPTRTCTCIRVFVCTVIAHTVTLEHSINGLGANVLLMLCCCCCCCYCIDIVVVLLLLLY